MILINALLIGCKKLWLLWISFMVLFVINGLSKYTTNYLHIKVKHEIYKIMTKFLHKVVWNYVH